MFDMIRAIFNKKKETSVKEDRGYLVDHKSTYERDENGDGWTVNIDTYEKWVINEETGLPELHRNTFIRKTHIDWGNLF